MRAIAIRSEAAAPGCSHEESSASHRIARTVLVPAVVGAGAFWLAYDSGSASLASQNTAASVVIWLLGAGVLVRALPFVRLGPLTRGVAAIFGLLFVWTLASVIWAPSTEAVIDEAGRLVLYGGTFVLIVVSVRTGRVLAWLDGLAFGLAGVAVLALFSRCFPNVVDKQDSLSAISNGALRLSYPVGYWNGLAVLVGLAVPLLLRTAQDAVDATVRAVAAGLLPALASVLYLTSSRVGAATTMVGILMYFGLTSRRLAFAVEVAVAAAGAAVAVTVASARDVFVNGPFTGSAAASEGRTAAVWIALTCLLTGVAHVTLARRLARVHVIPRVERGLLCLGFISVGIAVGVSHPIARVQSFTAAPAVFEHGDYIQQHLQSYNGNGRWQLWGTALREFEAHPFTGGGPQTYGSYQTEHGKLGIYVRDAHSLYVQTLAELGIVGFLLIVCLFAAAVVATAVALRRAVSPVERTAVAAAASSFAVFALACGFDWSWQLPAVAVAAIVVLALLARSAEPADSGAAWSELVRLGTCAVVVGLLWLVGAPLVAQLQVTSSQSAAADGNLKEARSAAEVATVAMPWASSPRLQLALVDERLRAFDRAAREAAAATARTPDDWQLWFIRARIEKKAGDRRSADLSLARARSLNPTLRLPNSQ